MNIGVIFNTYSVIRLIDAIDKVSEVSRNMGVSIQEIFGSMRDFSEMLNDIKLIFNEYISPREYGRLLCLRSCRKDKKTVCYGYIPKFQRNLPYQRHVY